MQPFGFARPFVATKPANEFCRSACLQRINAAAAAAQPLEFFQETLALRVHSTQSVEWSNGPQVVAISMQMLGGRAQREGGSGGRVVEGGRRREGR